MAKQPSQRPGATPYLVRVSGRRAWHIRDSEQRISTSETDRSAATRALIDYIEKNKIAEAESSQIIEKNTLSDILDLWAAKRQRDNPGTWAKKWRYIDGKLRERAGSLQLSEINDLWLKGYERSRYLDDGVSEPTVRQEVQIIVSAWSLALAASPPLTSLPVPVFDLPAASEPHDLFLTREESEKLIEAAKQRHIRLFLRLGFATGGRHEALLQLTWARVNLAAGLNKDGMAYGTIDLRNNVIDVSRSQERDERGRAVKAPRQKPRALVRVEGRLLEELAAAKNEAVTDHVIEFRGGPVDRVHKGFATAVKAAGLEGKGITPHIMRHSAITWLMQAGEDIYKVAGFAGHKDTKMIEGRYGHHHPNFQSGISKHLSQR